MKKKKDLLTGIIVILMAAVFIMGFFVLVNRKNGEKTPEATTVSPVDQVLLRDLERNYPPTPKEVLRFYSDLTTCFYRTDLTEEQLRKLALKAREIYDSELCADKTEEEYIEDLKKDILSFQAANLVVSGYSLSSSTDVEFFSADGFEFARLYANYRLRQGSEYAYVNEVFILRKDENGHWKIYGWDTVKEETDAEQVTENE